MGVSCTKFEGIALGRHERNCTATCLGTRMKVTLGEFVQKGLESQKETEALESKSPMLCVLVSYAPSDLCLA